VQPSTPLNKPNYQANLAGLRRLYRRREGVISKLVFVGAGQIRWRAVEVREEGEVRKRLRDKYDGRVYC
jgi:hypothetical protein